MQTPGNTKQLYKDYFWPPGMENINGGRYMSLLCISLHWDKPDNTLPLIPLPICFIQMNYEKLTPEAHIGRSCGHPWSFNHQLKSLCLFSGLSKPVTTGMKKDGKSFHPCEVCCWKLAQKNPFESSNSSTHPFKKVVSTSIITSICESMEGSKNKEMK